MLRPITKLAVPAALIVVCSLAARPAGAGAPDCTGISPFNPTTLARVTVATGVTGRPLTVAAVPGDASRIFIVEQNGGIRQLGRGAATASHTLFVDIDNGTGPGANRVNSGGDEQGLLGLAFDPDFQNNGFFYVHYTRSDGDSVFSRFNTIGQLPTGLGDPFSEKILFTINDTESNHNGGSIEFGPDGFLYIAMGDGGGGGDAHGTCGNGQRMDTLLGKILRIDPSGNSGGPSDCGLDASTYSVPASNPFVGVGGACDEIWAYGVRNPWRTTFDSLTGDLYIGDVGQGCWEEVNWQPASSAGGENYGWRLFEGNHCYNATQGCSATASPAGCSPACSDPVPVGNPVPNGTVLPIWDYTSNSGNCTIIGGQVYRGCRMPNQDGKYFYGDYCLGSVLSLEQVGGAATNHQSWTTQLGGLSLQGNLTSFGRDAEGEIYITGRNGLVYKIVPPLAEMEVSGDGAADYLKLSKADAGWSWEDIQVASQPVSSYRIYRASIADGVFSPGAETFDCVLSTAATTWPAGGDAALPLEGQWYAYVVVARNAGGAQTSPGGSPAYTLSAAACP